MSNTANPHAADHHDEHEHVVPLPLLVGVFACLLVLTIATVVVSDLHLGDIALMVAMVIAVIKGTLVGLFFMHLYWDSRFNGIAIIAAFIFLGLFISLCILDSAEYQPRQTRYNYANPALKPVAAPKGAIHVPAHGEHGDEHGTPAPHEAEHAPGAPATTPGTPATPEAPDTDAHPSPS